MIDILPELAAQIAAPLEKAEKLVFIDSGGNQDKPRVSEPSGTAIPTPFALQGIDFDKVVSSLMVGSNATLFRDGVAENLANKIVSQHCKE